MLCKHWRPALILTSMLVIVGCAPSTPAELLEAANEALAAGEPRTAEIHLKNLLQREPDDIAARSMLGEILLTLGDAPGAEHNLSVAIALGAESSRLHLLLLRSLLLQNKFSRLVEEASTGPPLEGAERALRLNMTGAAHRALGQLAAAERAYRESLGIEPESRSTRTELAAVYFQAGRTGMARTAVNEVLLDDESFVPALLLLGSIEAAAARYEVAQQLFERVLSLESGRQGAASYGLALGQLTETLLAQRNLPAATERIEELLALNPQAPIALYLKARVDMDHGNLAGAERGLESLIAATPDHWPSYVLLGVVNANQGQLGQAEMYLRRAANSNPRDARAHLLLIDINILQDKLGEARGLLDGPSATEDGVLLALAGRASLEAGQPELAADYFARSERHRPATVRDLIDVSSVYVAAGELERAIRMLEAASLQGADSARLASYLLTLVQVRRGDLSAADATARRLSDPSPESLNLRGTIAMFAEQYGRARGLFEAALAAQVDYVPAMLNLARVAVAEDDQERAADYLRDVIALDPNQVSAVFGLVQLAAARKDYAEAETWLARAPESVLRWRLAGDVRFSQGQFDSAAQEYARAFSLRPSADLALRSFAAAKQAGLPQPERDLLRWSEDNPLDPRSNFALGSVALERGDAANAVSRYERVLEADPAHIGALNNLAWLYGERGDERALGLAERAYAVLPNDPRVADTLGWLRLQRGDAASALPLLEKAVAAGGSDPEIRYHWAVALADTGNRDAARSELSELLSSGVAFPSARQARDRLAELDASTER